MKWTITTEKNKWISEGSTALEACVMAFKKHRPKMAGLVTKAKPSHGSPIYINTEVILKTAGQRFARETDKR